MLPSIKMHDLRQMAKVQGEEWERWIFRRAMNKSCYEAVRLEGDVIADENMKVTRLDGQHSGALDQFEQMRREAAMRAALAVIGYEKGTGR